jgi:hypothetical protein
MNKKSNKIAIIIYFPIRVFITIVYKIKPSPRAVEIQSQPTRAKVATISVHHHPEVKITKYEKAEIDVDTALRGLNENRYFVFRDLIIPSSYSGLSFTQIDHVVVSRHGIFCIETKSTKGNIYGYSRQEKWKQYLNDGSIFSLNSPFRQNYHHVKSLELLLKGILRAPVHSYVAFPYAHKVVVDNIVEDMSTVGVVSKINKHTQPIYDAASIEKIAKVLAHEATFREELRSPHREEVRAYVESRVTASLKYS